MNGVFTAIIGVIIGATVTVGAVNIDVSDILASANGAASFLSSQQVKAALGLYYLDHGTYPQTDDVEIMFNELNQGAYIEKRPINAEAFSYQYFDSGERYTFLID
ncbi:MAG: hypothetical protein HYV68_01630 [Candidatus Taylorbacteria bacterium]|nr:hypothetical protein [Candidatus Taylorbacteria bacterium]